MSEEVLALGQREIEADGAEFSLTAEELALLETNGVTVDELREFVRTSGKQTINAAIGGVSMLKKGEGQDRSEPFTPAETPKE